MDIYQSFKRLLFREFVLVAKRGTDGISCILLYGMMLLFSSFSMTPLSPSISFFFLLLVLTQGVGDALREDYRHGFLDMIYSMQKSFLSVLISKAFLWFMLFGIPLGILGVLAHSFALCSMIIFLLPTILLSTITTSLMVGSLLLGAASMKGGLLIIAFPFYIPLYLALLCVIEQRGEISLPLLSLGILLFYVPLTLMIANKALKEAIHNK
jgi:hypothetical protein